MSLLREETSFHLIKFHMTAFDDFGRLFNYVQALNPTHLDYMIEAKRDIYQYLFRTMTNEILRKMGTAVAADWECSMTEERFEYGTSTEV